MLFLDQVIGSRWEMLRKMLNCGFRLGITRLVMGASLLAFQTIGFAGSMATSVEKLAVAQSLTSSDLDAGFTYPLSEINTEATLTNNGSVPLSIDKIVPRWPGTVADVDLKKKSLQPGESTQVAIRIESGDGVGRYSHVFLVFQAGSAEPVAKIAVRGFADWVVDPASLSVDAGMVRFDSPFTHKFVLKVRPGTTVRLDKVVKPNKWFDAQVIGDGKALLVTGKRGMDWGAFDETIFVSTDSKVQPTVAFHVRGELRGAIAPSQNMVSFGAIREGTSVEQAVSLESLVDGAVNVGDIAISGTSASVTVNDCIPASRNCKLIKLKLGEQKVNSAPQGVMSIPFPDYKVKLDIPFGGSVIGKNTVVRDLEKEIESARNSPASITSALQSAVHSTRSLEMDIPPGDGPLLKWQVANESKIFGYEIYRSAVSEGPFERVSRDMIRRLSDDATVSSIYRWRDSGTVRGKEYWYYIGTVYLDGKKEPLSTPQRIVSK